MDYVRKTVTLNVTSVLILIFALFMAIIAVDLLVDYQNGGRRWQQGEWMIHWLAGPVRRGLMGTSLIFLSDHSGIGLLALTVGFQTILVLTVLTCLFLISTAVMTHWHQAVIFLLPPFHIMMMVSWFTGAIYKDLLAVLALALFTLAIVRPNRSALALWLGSFVMIIGVLSHEAQIFCVPAAIYLIWRADHPKLSLPLMIFVGTACTLAAGFAALFSQGNPDTICAELLARGISDRLCNGPISWLGASLERALSETAMETSLAELLTYFTAWLIAVLCLCYLLGSNLRTGIFLAGLTLLPVLPLFAIAFAHGRWLSFAFTSLVFVLLARQELRILPGQRYLAIGVAGLSSIITFDANSGIYLSGVAHRFADLIGL